MKIIIGLGNPGQKYEKTRHNAGFIMLNKLRDYFIDQGHNFENFTMSKNFNAQISAGLHKSEKVLLVKPQTYMNESGLAIKKIVDFYKINPEKDLIIIYDDVDLNFQEIRAKGKSSGGHKGMQSIIDVLESENLKRIRIGILGKEKNTIKDTSSYVLKNFENTEEKKLDKIFTNILPIIKDFLQK